MSPRAWRNGCLLSLLAWLAVGAALSLVLWPRHADASRPYRLVPVGANVRGDAQGRPYVQRDPRHASVGIVRPRCAGPYLWVEPRPASRYAPFLAVTVDGWLLRHGYSAGLASVQGRRVLVGFSLHGEAVACDEVMSHPEGNVWLVGQAVVR